MVEDKTQLHAGNSRLRLATDQISSLIVLSHSIKVFSSRWKLIRNKLNEILPLLPPEIHDSGDSHSPSFFGIIQAIEETTEFTTNLAQKCIDLSYTGKLLMQSDLDIICVKFNNHIKSLSELSSSTDAFSSNGRYAVVVSRPGPTASRDDIRFYFVDLLSRFKIGSNEMKEQALICFSGVIQEDINRCVKIAMEIDGLALVLVEFLGSKEVGIQEEALRSLDMICGFDSYKGVLASIGIVAPLIRALESGSHLSKKLSARCLMKFTADSDNAWSVSAHGGVTALLRISASESENGAELVGLACGVLKNLVGVEEIKRFIVEEGTIPMFINLVKSVNEVTQISAIEFLQSIASGDELVANLIANEGGIPVLVRVLDPNSSFSPKTREKSIMAIMSICSNPTRLNNLVSYGFMDHILHFLRNGEVSVQESCLKAAFWLCGTSDEFKKAMGDAGFMPELIKFVAAKSFEVREIASETLSSLVSIPRNRKRFVENDQNVSLLLQSIDPEVGTSGNRKLLLPIIMSLSGCTSGRKKILGSGYLKNIEKLADEQVSDAKKIVKNLSSNRFVRMIRGIWR
ncbi:hypothetical protein L6452_31121 [Arctium lappa]|uniref:Uncharacterized protein n=1 Tax=Arctium lappa TaxID=4217 RepID=A0ACB8ZJK9_ARCLA|nr:hypothetical protein L6452_31121 [Arctium lappa]